MPTKKTVEPEKAPEVTLPEKRLSFFSQSIPASIATAGAVGMVISLIIGIAIGGAIERSNNLPVRYYAPGPDFVQTNPLHIQAEPFHYWMDIHENGIDVRAQQA
jgi:hypothetical protein